MIRLITALVIMISLTLSAYSESNDADSTGENDKRFSPYVDENGNISRPEGFRENWVHLGTWFVKDDDMASGPGVHDVYASPESVAEFKKNGKWPDGAVLVKTVSEIETKQLTTGNAQWAGEIKVWFVMVRDHKNRFPDNKAWGEGWGWALFTSDDPQTNLTSNWRGTGFNNCFGCHAPVQDTEWVYLDGYPTVRDSARYPKLGESRKLMSRF